MNNDSMESPLCFYFDLKEKKGIDEYPHVENYISCYLFIS